MLARQLAAQHAFYGLRPDEMDDEERMASLRTNAYCAVDEITEAMREVGWKPWKKRGFGVVNRAAFAHEIADVVMFLLNMLLAAGITGEELADALDATWAKNEQRQKDGY